MLKLKELYNTLDLVFLTNALGEETGHEEINKRMRAIFDETVCMSNVSALMYFAKLNGIYGILANYEFDDTICEDRFGGDREKMRLYVLQKAEHLDMMWGANSCDILFGDGSGVDGCYELAIFINLFKPRYDTISMLREAEHIIDDDSFADSVRLAKRLDMSTPEGKGIRDADTILADIMSEAEMEVNGIGQELFRIWENAEDKSTFEDLFYAMTGCTFISYVNRCIDETTVKANVKKEIKGGKIMKERTNFYYFSEQATERDTQLKLLEQQSGGLLTPSVAISTAHIKPQSDEWLKDKVKSRNTPVYIEDYGYGILVNGENFGEITENEEIPKDIRAALLFAEEYLRAILGKTPERFWLTLDCDGPNVAPYLEDYSEEWKTRS